MTRRTRSAVMVSASSISIRMKRRLPPSWALSFKTAWAVVPEPAKLSRISASLLVAICKIRSISVLGFGFEKSASVSLKNFLNSFLAS